MPEDDRSARWHADGDIAMSLPVLASLLWNLDASVSGRWLASLDFAEASPHFRSAATLVFKRVLRTIL